MAFRNVTHFFVEFGDCADHLDPAAGGEDVNQRLPDEPDIGNDAEADDIAM